MFNPQQLKKDFPILSREINGHPLAYLDNAATSQKPHVVVKALSDFYEQTNANVHRGIHTLSEESTIQYEETRQAVADFINARSAQEIIFTRNTTEAVNLVASQLNPEDEVIVSEIEHHSNLIPWQQHAKVHAIPMKDDYTLDLDAYAKLINTRTKLVAITGMSNVTGYIPPLQKIIQLAHQHGAQVLIDGAQSVSHLPTDVQSLNCDYLAFSAHKMLGPTGVGVLYAKEEALSQMKPTLFGGGMVTEVDQHSASFQSAPQGFEAGTPNIADVVAFKAALDYLQEVGLTEIHKHELALYQKAKQIFSQYPQVQLQAPPDSQSGGILSFTVKNAHPHDIAEVFNQYGVAIRAGHHCCQPLMKRLNLAATARISFYLYNTEEDIAQAEKALKKVIEIFD